MELFGGGNNGNSSEKDTVFLMGGVALIVFGTGLVLSNPAVRRLLGQVDIGSVLQEGLPDIQRYFKLRAM